MPRRATHAAAVCLSALAASATLANVDIFDGQTLTESDLNAGTFMGQGFTLGPSTEFNFLTGGALAPVGMFDEGIIDTPFDFMGSTLNLLGGNFLGTNAAPMNIANATINIESGGIGTADLFVSNTHITQTGGALGETFLRNNSSLLLSGNKETTSLNRTTVDSGSHIGIAGGDVSRVTLQQGTADISGGNIHSLQFHHPESAGTVSGEDTIITDLSLRSGSLTVESGWVSRYVVRGNTQLRVNGGTSASASIIGATSSNPGTPRAVFTGGKNLFFVAFAHALGVITGGTYERIVFESGADVELRVTELRIDGVPIDLVERETIIIPNRDGELLEATLADGTYFDLDLDPQNLVVERDYVTEDAIVRVTLVPAPATALLAAPLGMVALRRRR